MGMVLIKFVFVIGGAFVVSLRAARFDFMGKQKFCWKFGMK